MLQAQELPQQVESLLRAVNSTNDFEAEMSQRFGGASAPISEEVPPRSHAHHPSLSKALSFGTLEPP